MDYLEFRFKVEPAQPASDILTAELGVIGFESFIEHEDGITAYIQKEDFREEMLSEIQILNSAEFKITYTSTIIAQINWNEEWEKNFEPILVDGICAVRAPFHSKPEVKYDIVIEPKMSFGTGHHATTHMMIQFLLKADLEGKKVLDMGCGTGVLAILAEKRGAKAVDAIDIDHWCYENSLENVNRNDCEKISVYEGTAALLKDRRYDVIIANINRNILLQDITAYADCLERGGELYLSGFYEEDCPAIKKECEKYHLDYQISLERDNWMALRFLHVDM